MCDMSPGIRFVMGNSGRHQPMSLQGPLHTSKRVFANSPPCELKKGGIHESTDANHQ